MIEKRKPTIILALLPLLALLISAIISQFFWKVGMFVPLIIGIIVGALVATRLGYKWDEQQKFMVNGVSKTIPVVFILFIIGTIVGTWMISGTIPLLIYYGLALISPAIFIPTAALTTGVMSLAIGSSFTSIATVGVALLAVGTTMGYPPGIVVGAIVSGAFLGDKLSPLSDTTNMTPAMVDTDLFSHVRHMMWDTLPAFLISLVLFWFVGNGYSSELSSKTEVVEMMAAMKELFNLNVVLLLLPILTIIALIKRWPAIPTLILLSVVGGLFAMIFQGSSLTQVFQAMTNGFSAETGNSGIDGILNRGGLTSMFHTIGVVIVAVALGGLLEGTEMLKRLVDALISKVKSTGSLILSTALVTLGVGFASGSQTLAIVFSGRGFQEAYKVRGLDTKNLSRCVEASGTVGISLVPWGVPAIFTMGVLGVNPASFIPFIFFAMIVPIVNVIYGYTGFTIAKKDYPETIKPIDPPPNQSITGGIGS